MMKNLSFVAIDFEKLNEKQTSVCEVGMVRFENGVKVEEFESVIRPYGGLERNSFGKGLRRITDEMLMEAPTYKDLFQQMKEFIGDSVVVCHQVSADINYIYNLQKELDLEDLYHSGYIDTMTITKAVLGLGGIAESYETIFGKSFGMHHKALDDARACGEVLVALASEINIEKFLHTGRYVPSKEKPVDYRTPFGTRTVSTDGIIYADDSVELTPSFWMGKTVVISGMDDKAKKEAIKVFIESNGGKCAGSLSGRTDIFLTGNDNVGPSKKVKAKDLQQSGGKLIAISLRKFEEVFGNI